MTCSGTWLDERGDDWCSAIRLANLDPAAQSLAEPNLNSGLLLISTLPARLLGEHGAETPIANHLLERYTLPESTDDDNEN